jgi:hypothetical protein
MPLGRQDIQDQIDSLLGDNSSRDITPQRLRTVLSSILANVALAIEVPQATLSIIALNDLAVVNQIALPNIPAETFVLLSNANQNECQVIFIPDPYINNQRINGNLTVGPNSAMLVYVQSVTNITVHGLVPIDFPA